MSTEIHLVMETDYEYEHSGDSAPICAYADQASASAKELELDATEPQVSHWSINIPFYYSHRNGEANDPEVKGHYWVEVNGKIDVWEWDYNNGDGKWGLMSAFGTPTAIYGPIPMPTRKENPT